MFSWFCKMHQSILPVDFICFIVDTLLLRNLQRSWETAQKYRFCNVNAAKSNFEALWYIIQISLLGFWKDLLRWQYVQIPRANIPFVKNCLQYLWCFVEMFCKKSYIPFDKLFRVAEVGKLSAQKMPSILSSDAYLLIRDKKRCFFAYYQNCNIKVVFT